VGHENDASAEDMERYFQEISWTAAKVGDNDWEVRYRGDVRDWIFYVRMTDYWVYFYATVLNKIKDECRPNVYEHIGLLNYKISLAKYSINSNQGVSVGVELPRENLKFASMINDALGALSINADENYLELVNLANDPSRVSSLRPTPEAEATTGDSATSPTPPTTEDTDVDWSASGEEGAASAEASTPAPLAGDSTPASGEVAAPPTDSALPASGEAPSSSTDNPSASGEAAPPSV
jgi:hypothetical protein